MLAPCILPLLPVVIGSAATGRSKLTPYIVVGSLSLSIIIFTFLLKASTALISIPPDFWTYLSGTILVFFGVTLVWPKLWDSLPLIRKASVGSNKLLGTGYQKKSVWGDVIVGASLGPIFSTCSPTYFVILASVLPVSYVLGTVYILAYVIGLALVLLLIAILGERFVGRLASFSDPNGIWKKLLGGLFILVGVFVALGLDKQLQTKILDSGYFDITKVEQKLLNLTEPTSEESQSGASTEPIPYVEIENPSGFVNTDGKPITIAEYVGKQVILLDIMTYSCINCQRTFPYVAAWYEAYKDDGLIVIGIHTPEFAFEKEKSNVEKAMQEFGISFPVVLDNDYSTWRALGNKFWPRKYLIDIHGNIVYDHIGEGAYAETEEKIQALLKERMEVLGLGEDIQNDLVSGNIQANKSLAKSPEIYFGSARNQKYLKNGTAGVTGTQTFVLPDTFEQNGLYLGGEWNVTGQYVEALADSVVVFPYVAQEVFFVAESGSDATVEVLQDGITVMSEAGLHVKNGQTTVGESRLYKLIKNEALSEHTLELRVEKGVRIYTFTFG